MLNYLVSVFDLQILHTLFEQIQWVTKKIYISPKELEDPDCCNEDNLPADPRTSIPNGLFEIDYLLTQ